MDNAILMLINIISVIVILSILLLLYYKNNDDLKYVVSEINQTNITERDYNKAQDAQIIALKSEIHGLQTLLSNTISSENSSQSVILSAPTSSPIFLSTPASASPSPTPAPASSSPIFLSTPAPVSHALANSTTQETISSLPTQETTSSSFSALKTQTAQETINCSVSAWKNSGNCSVNCGGGTLQETRTVINRPTNGGVACPVLSESIPCNIQACLKVPILQGASFNWRFPQLGNMTGFQLLQTNLNTGPITYTLPNVSNRVLGYFTVDITSYDTTQVSVRLSFNGNGGSGVTSGELAVNIDASNSVGISHSTMFVNWSTT